jgi:hypothetical protein
MSDEPISEAAIEQLAKIIREEIVRQYREDERGKCPAGTAYYEETISPWLIAQTVASWMRTTRHTAWR